MRGLGLPWPAGPAPPCCGGVDKRVHRLGQGVTLHRDTSFDTVASLDKRENAAERTV